MNHIIDEDGRPDYARKSEDGNTREEQQIRNQLNSLSPLAGHSCLYARLNMKCQEPTVVNLSKGASARVDADAITTPSVPRLTHAYSASDFQCLFGFAHFPASRPTLVFSSSCQSRLLPAFAQHESPRTPTVTADNVQRWKARSQCSVDPQFAPRLER